MGIDNEKIDQIIEMHTETVNGLKEQLASYKSESEKLSSMSKELQELTEYKEKYEAEKKSFDDFKKNMLKCTGKSFRNLDELTKYVFDA